MIYFLQFLQFSKILDFIYFTKCFYKIKKYLLKQYVIYSVFCVSYSKRFLLSTKPQWRLTENLINTSVCIFAIVVNEPLFLRWRCQGQLGWLDLAWHSILRIYTIDWASPSIFEETFFASQLFQSWESSGFFWFIS